MKPTKISSKNMFVHPMSSPCSLFLLIIRLFGWWWKHLIFLVWINYDDGKELTMSLMSTSTLTKQADGVMLNGLCGINGATGQLDRSPQIHQQQKPSAQGPGDTFHVLQWRDITEATSTLCCTSNNASKHRINPPPLYPCLFRWKVRKKVLEPSAPKTADLQWWFSHKQGQMSILKAKKGLTDLAYSEIEPEKWVIIVHDSWIMLNIDT